VSALAFDAAMLGGWPRVGQVAHSWRCSNCGVLARRFPSVPNLCHRCLLLEASQNLLQMQAQIWATTRRWGAGESHAQPLAALVPGRLSLHAPAQPKRQLPKQLPSRCGSCHCCERRIISPWVYAHTAISDCFRHREQFPSTSSTPFLRVPGLRSAVLAINAA